MATSTKRKLDEVEVEDGLRNHIDEVPVKKRDISSSHSESGFISGLISSLPNWRTMFPSQPKELLPTRIISSQSSSESVSNSEDLPVDIDSKKRHRSDESVQEDSQKMMNEETANESEDEIVGIRKIPRRTEKSSPLRSEMELEQKSVSPETEKESIYLSKPHISLRPPQLANHSSQLLLDQPKDSPPKSHHRPVLRSRHAVDSFDLFSLTSSSSPPSLARYRWSNIRRRGVSRLNSRTHKKRADRILSRID
jgi:hypothetical protein